MNPKDYFNSKKRMLPFYNNRSWSKCVSFMNRYFSRTPTRVFWKLLWTIIPDPSEKF